MGSSTDVPNDGTGAEPTSPANSGSLSQLFKKLQGSPIKQNIDISLQVSPDTECIRVNTSVLRYSRVLDETFDKLGFEEHMPVVPLFEDHEGTASFALFYWWATRDPGFSITKENLLQLLTFTDKYDVPLLVNDIAFWAKQQHSAQVDMQFCTVMLCHCLKFTYLRNELSFWYETIASTKNSSKLLVFLASHEFKSHLGCDALHGVVIGLVRALQASEKAELEKHVAEAKAVIVAESNYCTDELLY